jgi:heme exporter protein D
MSFASWQEFFAMGGYALYVWSSYGLTLLVLAAVVTAPWLRHRRLLRELARRERLEQRERRKQESP